MNPDVSQQLLDTLFAPLMHMVWCYFVPALVLIGMLGIAKDLILGWAERTWHEFVRDVVTTVQYLFGNPRVSDEAIRRARGSRYRSR